MRIAARRVAVLAFVHGLVGASVGCSLFESFDGYTDGGTGGFDARGLDSGYVGAGDGSQDTSRPDVKFVPLKDTGVHDTSVKQDAVVGTDSAPMMCPDNTVFSAIPWSPPSMFLQGACTPAETANYVTTLNNSSFATSGSASCDACIQTDYASALHGPIITAVINGAVTPIEINYGGCLANLDGSKLAGSCGNVLNNGNDCAYQECGDCSDWGNPQMGGATNACLGVVGNGACSGLELTTSCHDETLEANVEQLCLGPLQVLLDQWCGAPADSGAPPEAGAGDGPVEQ